MPEPCVPSFPCPPNQVILAYKQNGRLLTPDHGYPLRCVPGGNVWGTGQ